MRTKVTCYQDWSQVTVTISIKQSRWARSTRRSFEGHEWKGHTVGGLSINEKVVLLATRKLDAQKRQRFLPGGPVQEKIETMLQSVHSCLGDTVTLQLAWEKADSVIDAAVRRLDEQSAEAARAAKDVVVQKQELLFEAAFETMNQVEKMQASCQSPEWLQAAETELAQVREIAAAHVPVDTVPTREFLRALDEVTRLPVCKEVAETSAQIRVAQARV